VYPLQGVQTGSVAVAAYGIEKKVDLSRRKHDSMSDAEEGETWEQVIGMLSVGNIIMVCSAVVMFTLCVHCKNYMEATVKMAYFLQSCIDYLSLCVLHVLGTCVFMYIRGQSPNI
jgi:hypothetical protein